MLFTHWARRAASRAACTAGNSRAISTPMMAMTTSNSISVKPSAAMAHGGRSGGRFGGRVRGGRGPGRQSRIPGRAGGLIKFW